MKQLVCDSLNGMRVTQIILATAIHTPVRDMGPLEGTAAGSWSVGIVEGSRGRSAVDGGETARGDTRKETGGKCLWRKARPPWRQGDTAESVGWGHPFSFSLPQASTSS